MVLALTPESPDGQECAEKVMVDCTDSVVKTTRTATTQCSASRCGRRDEETLKGTHVNEVNVDEIKDSDDDTTGRRGGAPPSYFELSSHFVSPESAAEACGNGDAYFHLQARISFINARLQPNAAGRHQEIL